MTAPEQKVKERGKLTPGRFTEILFESAVESGINAFLILLMGGIALEIVGSVAQDMTPTLPPGVHFQQGWPLNSWLSVLKRNQFAIVFGLLLVPTLYLRLGAPFGRPVVAGQGTRLQKIGSRLAEDWFGLIIANAFGAMVSAMVVMWVGNFSAAQFLYHALLDWALPDIREFFHWALGDRWFETMGNWFSWYGQNQVKFTFWFVYLACVCDDLGIPNIKTLGRWALRRWRKRGQITPPPVPAKAAPVGSEPTPSTTTARNENPAQSN